MPAFREADPLCGADGSGDKQASQKKFVGRSYAWYATRLGLLLMVFLLWMSTPDGLGVSPDSTQYLATARNLLAGIGLKTIWWAGHPEPLTHFPPVYPLLIAMVGASGLDPAEAAGWIHFILLPLNALLVSWCASFIAGGSTQQQEVTRAVAFFAVALSPAFVTAHAMVWSEPLFMALLLSSLALLAKSIELFAGGANHRASQLLVAAAALTGVATVTRYAGIVLIATGTAVLMLATRDSIAARIRRVLAFGTVAVTPLMLWVAYNHLRGLGATNRVVALHPISAADLVVGVRTLGTFVVPYVPWTIPRIVALLGVALSVAVIAVMLTRIGSARIVGAFSSSQHRSRGGEFAPPSTALASSFVLFLAAYPTLLILSISFVDRSTALDSRILLPMLVIAIALTIGVGARLRRLKVSADEIAWRWLYRAVTLFAVTYFSSQIGGMIVWVKAARQEGIGLQAMQRTLPALFQRVRELPRGSQIYSNMPDAIYGVTGRVARGLPRRFSPTSLETNRAFDAEFGAIPDAAARPVYVVMFDAGADVTFVPSARDVETSLPIVRTDTLAGGRVFEVRRQSPVMPR